MVLDVSLLNTQHYMVWIKGKKVQSGEKGQLFSIQRCVVDIEKGAFVSTLTTVTNFTLLYFKWGLNLQPSDDSIQ